MICRLMDYQRLHKNIGRVPKIESRAQVDLEVALMVWTGDPEPLLLPQSIEDHIYI